MVSHFYRGVSELPYKLLFAVIYTHLEFRYEVSHTITSHHVHHFHQTRIPDGTLLDYMVQYRKPLFPQFFLYPKKFLPENNPHHKEFHLRPYIQNNNDTESTYIVSSSYVVFDVARTDILLSDYLFMYFNRPEFDRYARFNSWGSARETFSWEDMCDIDIELPPIEIQQKYVDIYNAMLANQRSCECGLDDLRMICTAHIEALRRKGNLKRIGDYIRPYNEKNTDGSITLEQGINIEKQFITPQRSNANLTGRKIVRKGMFAYCTQLNNENVAIAYRTDEDCVVSSVYDVFEIIDKNQLVPEYLMLWLIRPEFGRFVYYESCG